MTHVKHDLLNTKISSEEDGASKGLLESELRLHQRKTECAYHQLKEDTALRQSSQDVNMITFDLHRSLPTPKLATNVFFTSTRCGHKIFGIHDPSTGRGFMFMWPESITSRGSLEVCSCVLKYLALSNTAVTHLIVYRYACGEQNHNIDVACMWMQTSQFSQFHCETQTFRVFLTVSGQKLAISHDVPCC